MTKENLNIIIKDFVLKHNRFPTSSDIPSLPSLRTLQRYGIYVSDFIAKPKHSEDQTMKMQESSYKILSTIPELTRSLIEKGYNVKNNHQISLDRYKIANIICEKNGGPRYAIELISPSSLSSVPTSIRRRIYKYPYSALENYHTVFIVNINTDLNINLYRPRTPFNSKIKIINLDQLPLL